MAPRVLIFSLLGALGLVLVGGLILSQFGYLALGGTPVIEMPGESFAGPLPKLSETQRRLAEEMRETVETLADRFGERNTGRYDALVASERWLHERLTEAGLRVERQAFVTPGGNECANLIVEFPGAGAVDARGQEIVVVGAHYDSARGAPGANDNGSGVAAVLALAARFKPREHARTLRLCCFVNEEPPHFQTQSMGSLVYAKACKARGDAIPAMFSLETIGYFSDEPGSQKYPPPFDRYYPRVGNYIGFVGNVESADLVRRSVASFRRHARFPSQGGALPAHIPGVGWSDHWSFWEQGYPALMVTDTAPFRYPHYHTHHDTPDKLDYPRMARVVEGVEQVIREELNR
jgi:hypothetical protein